VIRLSVFYPSTEGASFDHDYYRDSHVPLCVKHWSPAEAVIEKGINGPYVAAVHFAFDSMEAFQQALASPGTAELMADVANYTSIQPVQQVSEVVE
jgi:uncharacterized protein (TIGR02118 family)